MPFRLHTFRNQLLPLEGLLRFPLTQSQLTVYHDPHSRQIISRHTISWHRSLKHLRHNSPVKLEIQLREASTTMWMEDGFFRNIVARRRTPKIRRDTGCPRERLHKLADFPRPICDGVPVLEEMDVTGPALIDQVPIHK
jgi:hypothetical protein